ncbi:MAG TPA: MgtC/SapB family protein [Brevundimonas sp.]|jgi:putative Mg2+ transporter-C (MgtC) family protein|uniref:MgtC/SapB family protein n=1 Tax=Brevundimonas sp. TaxID=1871086 RepID=UPI002E1636CD|nr:MgtC/SapB family protein [Brevundimonas sp.]
MPPDAVLASLLSPLPEILGAVVAGGLIGLEREWRGRSAGFRTHILVALAACVLMQAAVRQDAWTLSGLTTAQITTDPVRMAHGILTGVGFLCGGVIFRTGFSVHGLTTAASLWISSAIGTLFGVGMSGLGMVAAFATLLILALLRVVSRLLPARTVVYVSLSWERGREDVRRTASSLLRGCDPRARGGEQRLSADDGMWRRQWRLKVTDAALDDLAERLADLPGVRGVQVDPRET